MDLQGVSGLVAAIVAPTELAVGALALTRRLWRSLPFFTAYLILLVIIDCGRWGALLSLGAGSRMYSWIYWMTQPVLILARGAALADLCRASLGPYVGVWKFARPLLLCAATLMLGLAAIHSSGTHWVFSYLIFLERELEFAVVIALLLLLLLGRYYGMVLERPLDGIALGLGLYSSFVITRDTIILVAINLPWWSFSMANSVVFAVVLGIWFHALWAPLPAPARPQLSTLESYERNSRAVGYRMRELNERLLSLMK